MHLAVVERTKNRIFFLDYPQRGQKQGSFSFASRDSHEESKLFGISKCCRSPAHCSCTFLSPLFASILRSITAGRSICLLRVSSLMNSVMLNYSWLPFQKNHASNVCAAVSKTPLENASEMSFEALVKYCEDTQWVNIFLPQIYSWQECFALISSFTP